MPFDDQLQALLGLTLDQIYGLLGLLVVGAPALLVAILGLVSLIGRPLPERVIGRIVEATIITGLGAALAILGLMIFHGERHVPVDLGNWVHFGHAHGEHEPANAVATSYHFSIKFVFDRLSVPMAILTFLLCGTIGAFANRYMHRERGFSRFFALYSFFVLGMIVTSLAGTIETLFAGWELVGLSSAFLVAFYQERSSPVRNGLRVWVVYRISDAALLIAAVIMHHYLRGHGDFDSLLGVDADHSWPYIESKVNATQALVVGSLILIAAAGKSALVPFSGWLPRAMEGPTPSSAVFYGALSVHLGAYLLLRVSPLFDASPVLCIAVITLGLTTSIFAAFAGRVQTDIKSALSFASLSQVGIIVVEIGLAGLLQLQFLRYVALLHILGHACFRTLQFVRAPMVLADYATLENAIGNRLPRITGSVGNSWSETTKIWLYRLALEKGYLDALLTRFFVEPFLHTFRICDRWERQWTDFLSGGPSRESDLAKTSPAAVEELI
jgi:NAD(P)H-quinone oxidoreductase subunit 5